MGRNSVKEKSGGLEIGKVKRNNGQIGKNVYCPKKTCNWKGGKEIWKRYRERERQNIQI